MRVKRPELYATEQTLGGFINVTVARSTYNTLMRGFSTQVIECLSSIASLQLVEFEFQLVCDGYPNKNNIDVQYFH